MDGTSERFMIVVVLAPDVVRKLINLLQEIIAKPVEVSRNMIIDPVAVHHGSLNDDLGLIS